MEETRKKKHKRSTERSDVFAQNSRQKTWKGFMTNYDKYNAKKKMEIIIHLISVGLCICSKMIASYSALH